MNNEKISLFSITLILLIEVLVLAQKKIAIFYFNLAILLALLLIYILNKRTPVPIMPTLFITFVGFFNFIADIIEIDGVKLYDVTFLFVRTDMVIHFLTAFSLTIIIYSLLKVKVKTTKNILLILSLLITMGFGALYEIFELIGTFILTTSIVGNYLNNALDLVLDLLGALASLLYLYKID